MKKQTVFMFFPLFFAFNAFHHPDSQSHRFYSLWNDQRSRAIDNYNNGSTSDNYDSSTPAEAATPQVSDVSPTPTTITSLVTDSSLPTVTPGLPNTGETADPSPTTITTSPSPTTPTTYPSPSGDVFSTGAVTFRFDDGWHSQIDSALPILDAAGIRGTYYIVTRQLSDDGFSGFLSTAEVRQLAAHGEDIGAHTQTHPHLPALSSDQQQAEIAGSRTDLLAMGVTPTTLSYPYGEYTPATEQIAKDSGFAGAVTTEEAAVSPTSDPYQIQSPSIVSSQSPAQIESMIDSAVQSHQWLVLTFHRVDNSGDQYSITPENFQAVVDYIKSRGIRTVTVAEGLQYLR